MKKVCLVLILLLTSLAMKAQLPGTIHYQAIARDSGEVVASSSIQVRATIYTGGILTYQETHTVLTNDFGLFTLAIGEGVANSGQYSDIDWALWDQSLEMEIDLGSGFVALGQNTFRSVPYALASETALLATAMQMDDLIDVDTTGLIPGHMLQWDGTQWVPVLDSDADPTNELQALSLNGNDLTLSNGNTITIPTSAPVYSAGVGVNISGNVISNTGDTDAADDITTSTNAGGDLFGLFPDPTVIAIQSVPVSTSFPTNGDVLKFQNGQWQPVPDLIDDADADPNNEIQSLSISGGALLLSNGGGTVNLPVYTAGSGIDIVGSVIINTGDLDATDDINVGFPAGGDLSGTYPSPTVAAIQGHVVSGASPITGQIFKWNGSEWTPANDLVDDADADATNELQTLNLSGNTLSLSNGGSVNLPTYTAGTGIGISGNTITNTGDSDASDDIVTSSTASGDVSGTFSSLSVVGIQGNSVASTPPSPGEVLKWDGTAWTPGADDSGNWMANGVNTELTGGNALVQNSSNQLRVEMGTDGSDNGFVNVYDNLNTLRMGMRINGGQAEVFGDAKNFRMDHPAQPTKEIWYASLEGPEAAAYARGTATLKQGQAHVELPEHFKLLAAEGSTTVLLTPLSGASKGLAVVEKSPEGFSVVELLEGKGDYTFDWEVKAVRKGFENYEVIRDK